MDDGTNPNLTLISNLMMTVNSDINVGTGDLLLQAGLRSRRTSITFAAFDHDGNAQTADRKPILTAANITLRQNLNFGSSAPATLTRTGILTVHSKDALTTQSWMFENNKGTIIISDADVRVSTNISIGTGDLSITAGDGGAGSIIFGSSRTLRRRISHCGRIAILAHQHRRH